MTEDDRQPNAFSPAADFPTQMPWFRQMGTGRSNYVVADLQLVHATALCDGAVTRFMLGPLSLSQSLLPRRSPKTEYLGLSDQNQRRPHLVGRFFYPQNMGAL